MITIEANFKFGPHKRGPTSAYASTRMPGVDLASLPPAGAAPLSEALAKETISRLDKEQGGKGVGETDMSLSKGRGPDGLNPEFKRRLDKWLADHPGYRVVSGYRSHEHQARLWARSDKSGHWVARPGHSRHELGIAADISRTGGLRRGGRGLPDLREYGLHQPMAWEPWHVEPLRNWGGAAARVGLRNRDSIRYRAGQKAAGGSVYSMIETAAKGNPRVKHTMRAIFEGESEHKPGQYDVNQRGEYSVGPFQLNKRGGLGAVFQRETGLDPARPGTVRAQADWVADYISRGRGPLSQWRGLQHGLTRIERGQVHPYDDQFSRSIAKRRSSMIDDLRRNGAKGPP